MRSHKKTSGSVRTTHREQMVNSSVLYDRGKHFHVPIKSRSTITSAYIGALPGGKEGHYSKQPQKLEDCCACVLHISLNNNNNKNIDHQQQQISYSTHPTHQNRRDPRQTDLLCGTDWRPSESKTCPCCLAHLGAHTVHPTTIKRPRDQVLSGEAWQCHRWQNPKAYVPVHPLLVIKKERENPGQQ